MTHRRMLQRVQPPSGCRDSPADATDTPPLRPSAAGIESDTLVMRRATDLC